MTTYWFPAQGHPDGLSPDPWFRVEGEWGFRASGHPEGESKDPCFKIVDDWAYPTFGLPNATDASFEVIGSFVYAAGIGGPPWFLIDTEPMRS